MSRRLVPRLHIITEDSILSKPDFINIAIDLLLALNRSFALHLRAQHLSGARLFEIAKELAPKASLVGTMLVVNDRVDIAAAAGAHAIQIGVKSLPVSVARKITPASMRVGYSAHSAAEAAAAQQGGADFILAGTIFQSLTHPDAEPAGLEMLEACVSACSIPVYAIGGITLDRVDDVVRTGADGLAVIRAVWEAPDPVQAAGQFAKLLR
jgi:thiamine-phosphate diphosphorylase